VRRACPANLTLTAYLTIYNSTSILSFYIINFCKGFALKMLNIIIDFYKRFVLSLLTIVNKSFLLLLVYNLANKR